MTDTPKHVFPEFDLDGRSASIRLEHALGPVLMRVTREDSGLMMLRTTDVDQACGLPVDAKELASALLSIVEVLG